MNSNVTGILLSKPHGGLCLAKQTSWGDEYVAFDMNPNEAWRKLAKITGTSVISLRCKI